MNWINLATFSLYAILVSALIYNNIRLVSNNSKMAKEFAQTIIDNVILNNKIQELMLANQPDVTEGFIKFLSQSRDWAFEYIEDVQSQLNKFVEIVGPEMEYYDKFGRIATSPHTPQMDKIFDAYNELINLLPETENKQGENNE